MSSKVPSQYLSVFYFGKVFNKKFSFQRILLIFLLSCFTNFSEAHGYQNLDKKFQAKLEKVLASKDKLVLVIKHEYKLYLYFSGRIQKKYEIALSQSPVGRKNKKGDLKVPEGEYKICKKAKGPFGSKPWWKVYFGPRWIKINYPNEHDALIGYRKKIIIKNQYEAIVSALRNNRIPPQNTGLGGGIGIHGWSPSDWENDGNRNITWGCISMHNDDLIEFYDLVGIGTKIIISE
jgi:murein L,D-transpeptidase YafK